MMTAQLEVTAFTKHGGALTKRISLNGDGTVHSDGSQCVMTHGTARRLPLTDLGALAAAIGSFGPQHAVALGGLRPGLPDEVEITTKAKLNGVHRPDLIARTNSNLVFRPGSPALALIDYDTKGMPPAVAERIDRLGGVEAALFSVLPALESTARLLRASTSAGLYRSDTGEKLPGGGGLHEYLLVRDGADVERFLKTLHARCWLAGLGWLMLGAGGQVLERSIVDRVVGSPERLVFEGPPVLVPPLGQDPKSRAPVTHGGDALDTIAACPVLSILEEATFRDLRSRALGRIAPDVAKARSDFVAVQTERLAARTGLPAAQAARIVERQCGGVLLPDVVLPFDDPDLADITVAQVLADPARYVGETLADPLEGVDYGRGKAKIMRRADGSVWIHSFAHGRTVYDLKLDGRAAEAALEAAAPEDLAAVFVRLVLDGEFDPSEVERLRNTVSERTKIGKRPLDAMLKEARTERAAASGKEARDQRLAERQDPRPLIPAPLPDGEWLPVMMLLNEVHARSTADEPPMRNLSDDLAWVRTGSIATLHLLTSDETNSDAAEQTRLAPPPQMLIARMSEEEAAEMIERHLEFFIETGDGPRPVHLAAPFVRHFMNRADRALPVVSGTSSLPLVLGDGKILTGHGLNRDYGIVFRVPHSLQLPTRCTETAVGKAMRFLCDEWLVDVAASYRGKAIIIACALTVIERLALPERPAFFITAGQRGGGKTTVLHLISTAVLGRRAAAAAWSSNEEERRKALFAYLGTGLELLVWDNIPLGAAIGDPSIEKALTSPTYSDRVLSETRTLEVPASTVQVFTGNNITACGDLASRTLGARLAVNRPDPENRAFHHPNPITWTEQHRGQILEKLYTILVGNPRLTATNPKPAETRFKAWYHLVGAAIEHAAQCHIKLEEEEARALVADPPDNPARPVRFRKLFLTGEVEDEQTGNLVTVLTALERRCPSGDSFQASEIASYAGAADTDSISFKAALEIASGKPLPIISAPTISARLKAIKDRPTQVGKVVLVLRYTPSHQGGWFHIERLTFPNDDATKTTG